MRRYQQATLLCRWRRRRANISNSWSPKTVEQETSVVDRGKESLSVLRKRHSFPPSNSWCVRTSPPSCCDLSSAYLTHRSTKTCVSAGGDFFLISLINKTSRIRVIQIGSVLKTRMAKISPITFVVCLLIQCNLYLFRLANCLHCKVLLHNFLKVYSRPTCV